MSGGRRRKLIVAGALLVAAGGAMLVHEQKWMRNVWRGPRTVTEPELAGLEDPARLPNPYVSYEAERVLDSGFSHPDTGGGTDRYVLAGVGERWLVARVPESFSGHRLRGALKVWSTPFQRDALAAITARHPPPEYVLLPYQMDAKYEQEANAAITGGLIALLLTAGLVLVAWGLRRPARTRLLPLWARMEKVLSQPDWLSSEVEVLRLRLGTAILDASPEERAAMSEQVARDIESWGVLEGGLAALFAWNLVEAGQPPARLFRALIGRLPGVLAHARRFAARVEKAFPQPDEPERCDDGVLVGKVCVPRAWALELAARDPEAFPAWNTLREWCLATVSCASRAPTLRGRLAGTALPDLPALAALDEWARWLYQLQRAPCAEAMVFVDAPSGRVFDVRVDGVCANFELHTLLAAALSRPLGHAPPPRPVLDCLAAKGFQQIDVPSEGVWNLYAARAAAAVRSAGDVPTDLWIWNEGAPWDVPLHEGRRTIVAGPPLYARSWSTSRTFPALAPRVELLGERPAEEARAFMDRLLAG